MAKAEDQFEGLSLPSLRAEVRRLARQSRASEVAQQVEGTRRLIDESRKLLEWVDSLRLV